MILHIILSALHTMYSNLESRKLVLVNVYISYQ